MDPPASLGNILTRIGYEALRLRISHVYLANLPVQYIYILLTIHHFIQSFNPPVILSVQLSESYNINYHAAPSIALLLPHSPYTNNPRLPCSHCHHSPSSPPTANIHHRSQHDLNYRNRIHVHRTYHHRRPDQRPCYHCTPYNRHRNPNMLPNNHTRQERLRSPRHLQRALGLLPKLRRSSHFRHSLLHPHGSAHLASGGLQKSRIAPMRSRPLNSSRAKAV